MRQANRLRRIVETLGKKCIYLEDSASIQVAKMYIEEQYQQACPETIERYCRNLRVLLRCPPDWVPDRPSITGSFPA